MRIIHLTDLHLRHYLPGTSDISERASRSMPALLGSVVESCVRERPQVGVLSGDLVDVPTAAERDAGLQELAWRDLLLVREALAATAIPWIVVAGNHDLGAQVAQLWEAEGEFRVGEYRFLWFSDQERADHVPVRSDKARRRMTEVLGDDDPTPQIHVQHYLVHPRRDQGYPHSYLDAEAMAAALTGAGRVSLVLSGHYHPGVAPTRVGDTWFITAPAACVAPYPALVYDLTPDGMRWRRIELEVDT